VRRVYVGGTFDLFHAGHVALLRRSKLAFPQTHVIVSLNKDEFAARYKRPPVLTLRERIEVVSACRYVDTVAINEGDEDSKPAILGTGATHIVHGTDWTDDGLMRQMGLTESWLEEHDIQMLYVPYTDGISTSEIIRRAAAAHEHRWF